MPVLQMQRIYICGLKMERKRILETLQRAGVVETSEMLPEGEILKKSDVSSSVSMLNKNSETAREALETLKKYSSDNSSPLESIKGRKTVSVTKYNEFSARHDETLQIANRICNIPKLIAENKAEILKLKAQKEILLPWVSLDIPINFRGTKRVAALIGTLPGKFDMDAIYELLVEYLPIDVNIISSSKSQVCVLILSERKNSEKVFNTLRNNGFVQADAPGSKAPSEKIQDLAKQIADIETETDKLEEEARSYESLREDLKFLQDYESMRSDKYEVINHMLQSNNSLIITGYIPDKEKDKLKTEIEGEFTAAVEFELPGEKEDVPILLKNNGFAAPLESTVESFSLPGKGEVDPTAAVSLFYYSLFGLMLSDAAYGAIIAMVCAVLLFKFKNTIESKWSNILRMYFYCGIFTVFWGVMFGSYFGDLLDVITETFFASKVSIPPIWFFPVKEPMRMLVFSLLIGIIHLLFGLTMKLYQLVRIKEYKAVLFDVVFWYILLLGSTLKLLSMKMVTGVLGLSFILSTKVGNIAGMLALLAALGIILTNGRESKNPFKRVLKGMYALYGITGYLSDVLSYSRLLALGLATGVIATVINQMAAMAAKIAGGSLGTIIFIIIIPLGHLLNLGINALGAYVHTNRLHYVEFFGKFYGGGGRRFMPFSENTKYYKIVEEK